MPPGYGQENYMYGDPSMSYQGNPVGMYGSGVRPMSPPPGDEDISAHEHLPSALEEVLAYKEYRVRETGHSGEVDNISKFCSYYVVLLELVNTLYSIFSY